MIGGAGKKSFRLFLTGLCLIPVFYFLQFTGIFGLPAYLMTPSWVKNADTDNQLTQNLNLRIPLGTPKWKFVEILEKAGFKPGWGMTEDGHFIAIYSFGIIPCGTDRVALWKTNDKDELVALEGRVSRACL